VRVGLVWLLARLRRSKQFEVLFLRHELAVLTPNAPSIASLGRRHLEHVLRIDRPPLQRAQAAPRATAAAARWWPSRATSSACPV